MLNWDDVAVILKTVPSRARLAASIFSQLSDQKIEHRVCLGISGEPPRSNFVRMLQMALHSGKEWCGHIEDDAYLAPDFSGKCLAYINSGIANVWTFYSSRKEDLDAYDEGKKYRYITPSQYYNSQAVFWPTVFCQSMIDYLPVWESEKKRGVSDVDVFIGSWCKKYRMRIFASIPSIVQHREVVSTLGHRAQYGRISRTFMKHYGVSPDVDPKHQAHEPRPE